MTDSSEPQHGQAQASIQEPSTSTSPSLPLLASKDLGLGPAARQAVQLDQAHMSTQTRPGPSAVDAAPAPAGQIPSASTSSATNAAAAPAGQTPTASAPSTTNATAAGPAGQKKLSASSGQPAKAGAAAPAGQKKSSASSGQPAKAGAAAPAGQKKSSASSAQLSMDLGQERNKGKSKAN
ncbi:unnamed protein product, partial [Tilletia controversa]